MDDLDLIVDSERFLGEITQKAVELGVVSALRETAAERSGVRCGPAQILGDRLSAAHLHLLEEALEVERRVLRGLP